MLVQALAEFTDRNEDLRDQLSDEAWEEKPVPYLIEISDFGAFRNITPRLIPAVWGKKSVSVPAPLLVPRSPVPRNAGLHPLLAADDIKYVLGSGPWTAKGQEENHFKRHQRFANLIRTAARSTKDEALEACARFYEQPDQVELARVALQDAKPGTIVALSVDGPLVKRAAVRSYWRAHYASASGTRVAKAGVGQCLISGRVGPIAPTHEKVKGLGLGGQAAGVLLMSCDKEAFQSYGWEQNANSPVAPDRALAYVLALNHLLRRDNGHRRDVAGVAFVFWTREAAEFDPMSMVDHADEAQVDALLRLDPRVDPDPNQFYMAGFSANGARMVIRYWASDSLGHVKANIKEWFAGQRIMDVYSATIATPPKLWQLLAALDREGAPPKDRTLALLRRAIEGPAQPLGYRILTAALARLRVSRENRLEPHRIGLIRLCLNDQLRMKGDSPMPEVLDLQERHEAYLCGRLLAVYESVQYNSAGETKVNQTVADRYYSLASTRPALAFPRLADLGQKHLRKLRRDKRGAMVALERQIQDILGQIERAAGCRFPASLDLDGQGRFVLGYHHQRADHVAAAKAYKQQHAKSSDTAKLQEEE
jgi:CRISPR-associated protein Csd1